MSFESIVGVCCGTKEKEECNCEGDMERCDFYAHRRAAAKTESVTDTQLNQIGKEESNE